MALARLAPLAVIVLSVFPQSALAGWKAVVVNDADPSGNSVSVVDTETDQPGAPIPVGVTPYGTAIAPDALTAWVANYAAPSVPGSQPSLQPIDLGLDPPAAGTAVNTETSVHPSGVAITPDGTAAYSPGDTGEVLLELDLTQDPPDLSSIPLEHPAIHIAITPDGRKAYLSAESSSSVIPVDLTTGTPGEPIEVGAIPRGIAVTPDGQKALVAVNGLDQVREIDTATDAVAPGGALVEGANGIAIAPDGETAWVSTWNGIDPGGTTEEDGFVVPVDIETMAAGDPVDVKTNGLGQAWGIAITPDGRKLYVSDGRVNPNGNTVRPVDLTKTPPQVGPPIQVGATPRWIAITPDQAPVASLNVTAAPPASATAFDASGSTSSSGPIARYDWDFGDGDTATTDVPNTTHVYAQPGTYTAKLTLTTEGGTSTEQVFTGQTLSRNGGPSARVERSIQIAASQPAVALDPALLDFGRVALGSSPTRTVTVTNRGAAPLQVGALRVEGEHPGDFALVDDGCATVAPGGNCAFGVRFAPRAAGDRRAAVRVESNAPGGPHLVTLVGAATDRAVLSGRVLDDAGAAVPGSVVQVCPGASVGCSQATAGQDGRYRIAGLVPGEHALRAFPPSRELAPADATLALGIAEERNHDVTLRRLPAFSRQLSLLTPNGLFTSGRPSVYWNDPLTFQYQVTDLPREAPPGTTYSVRVVFALTSGGARVTWDESARVTYGGDRTIETVTPIGGVSRARPRAAQADNCLDLLGEVNREDNELRRDEAYYEESGGPIGGLTAAILLNQARAQKDLYESVARRYLDAGCDPKKLPRPIDFPKPGPIDIDVDSTVKKEPDGEEKRGGGEAGGYIDPSGTVRTTSGVPLAGAKVVLQRRASAAEPFGAVPNGSILMSPSNRRNPDRTDQLGRFGWDVLAGTYRVRAGRRGCRAPRGRGRQAFTRALDVPPPRLGLVLRLRCRGIRRTATRVSVAARRGVLSARVRPRRARRARPLGTVTFRARRRVLGTAPVDPRTGIASTTVGRRAGGVRAVYSGDALFAPSRSRRRR